MGNTDHRSRTTLRPGSSSHATGTPAVWVPFPRNRDRSAASISVNSRAWTSLAFILKNCRAVPSGGSSPPFGDQILNPSIRFGWLAIENRESVLLIERDLSDCFMVKPTREYHVAKWQDRHAWIPFLILNSSSRRAARKHLTRNSSWSSSPAFARTVSATEVNSISKPCVTGVCYGAPLKMPFSRTVGLESG